MKCVEQIGKDSFDIDDVYAFERQLSAFNPDNKNVKPKIRQQLQYLRYTGDILFSSRGKTGCGLLNDGTQVKHDGLVSQPL